MLLSCIMGVMPRSPLFVIHPIVLNHFQRFNFVPFSRIHRGIYLKDIRVDNHSRYIVGVMNVMEAHSRDSEAKENCKERLLTDYDRDQQFLLGGIVALGKFDALHVGHRALAVQASKMGSPFLLSFTGIGEVLGWEKRLPVVAPCDRKRIMSLWTTFCGGAAPEEYQLEFAKVRYLSPREFVEKLALELNIKGVVAGANYRFGYKAAGDASDLVQLCTEYGLNAFIVDPVMDKFEKPILSSEEMKTDSREKGQVSSTRVRNALSAGDMKRVTELLGRKHRLVLSLDCFKVESNVLFTPLSCALNQPPREGTYSCKVSVKINENNGATEVWMQDGEVTIGYEQISITVHEGSFGPFLKGATCMGLDLESKMSS